TTVRRECEIEDALAGHVDKECGRTTSEQLEPDPARVFLRFEKPERVIAAEADDQRKTNVERVRGFGAVNGHDRDSIALPLDGGPRVAGKKALVGRHGVEES